MTLSVKTGIICRRKTQCDTRRKQAKRNGVGIVSVRSSKRKQPIKSEVVLIRSEMSARMTYCHMYDQEERDIAKAVRVLSKFAP